MNIYNVTISKGARKPYYTSIHSNLKKTVPQRYDADSSLYLLQDEGLIEAYKQACYMNLDQKFIALLRNEMFTRDLQVEFI